MQGLTSSLRKTHSSAMSPLPKRGGGVVGKGFSLPKMLGTSGTDDLSHHCCASTPYSSLGHMQLPQSWVPSQTQAPTLCVCSVQEFMTFTSQLIVERSELGSRASVKEQGKRTTQGQHVQVHVLPFLSVYN